MQLLMPYLKVPMTIPFHSIKTIQIYSITDGKTALEYFEKHNQEIFVNEV